MFSKTTFPRLVIFGALAASLAACGPREGGPSENEYGTIFFWQVETVDLVWDMCTDAEDIRSSIEAPEFEENSFIVYRVSDDGMRLVDQQCETTDAATCSDSDLDIVFEKNGDVYEYDQPAVVGEPVSPGCNLQSDPLWTLEDAGTELFLDVGVTFSLVGENCEGVDENIARSGTNEFGIDGCSATIAVVGDYYRRQRP